MFFISLMPNCKLLISLFSLHCLHSFITLHANSILLCQNNLLKKFHIWSSSLGTTNYWKNKMFFCQWYFVTGLQLILSNFVASHKIESVMCINNQECHSNIILANVNVFLLIFFSLYHLQFQFLHYGKIPRSPSFVHCKPSPCIHMSCGY